MKRLAHFSQHFLRDPRLVRILVDRASISDTDVVYDIGAGSGVISSVLARKAGKVIAIEFEPDTAKKLRANMSKYDNVNVQQADFMDVKLPSSPYKIFANIPFHLSSPIVRKLTAAGNKPEAIWLIVQKQFANKLLIDTDQFTGQLGAQVAPEFAVKIRARLKRTDFWPHPNVDTVMVELLRRDTPLLPAEDMPSYRSFVEKCFADAKFFAKTPQKAAKLPADIRPSQMKVRQWVELFQAASSKPRSRA